jgi:hypothetical protein
MRKRNAMTTIDGYIDGEWYGHQGGYIGWPPAADVLTIDMDACEQLRAVFHLLGDTQALDFTLLDEPKPWVQPRMADDYFVEPKPVEAGYIGWRIDPLPWPFPSGKLPEPNPAKPTIIDAVNCVRVPIGIVHFLSEQASAIQEQPTKTQPSGTAKSPLNGALTVSQGRHLGLGFCDQE